MPKLAANLTMLFTEHPFLDRFQQAARAGFRAVEFMFPYAHHADDINDRLSLYQQEVVLFNLPAGDWEAGERGIACHPDRAQEFREGVEEAIRYAKKLGVKRINCLAGKLPKDVDFDDAGEVLVTNLRHAARAFAPHGLELLLEPVNSRDVPGFFVSTVPHGLAILDAVGEPNAYLQFDIYHMQVMQGDLAASIERHFGRIRHIQIADHPGRNEPGTGEINYRYLLPRLDALGYTGWVGCEYRPREGTLAGLEWRAAHGIH